MDTAYSTEDLAFRDEVRGFFDEAYTPNAGAPALSRLQKCHRGVAAKTL